MRKTFLTNTLAIVISLLTSTQLSAQILDWEYESILDDTQQSGANPDMKLDKDGNIHISSWRQETNQLAYSFRNKQSGEWTYQVLDADNQAGYESAIIIDDNGDVHIAYLLKQGNDAFVKYATNSQGSWTYQEVLPLEALGKYGPDFDAPVYVQASLDISIQENGQPFISVFDGTVNGAGTCGTLEIYADYDLKLRAIARIDDETWQELNLPAIPFQGTQDCLRTGDRFGEFCKILQAENNRTYIFTNSVHNHKLIAFYSEPGDIFSWSYTEIDSLQRILSNIGVNQFRETFDYVDISSPNDSTVHLVFGISDLYGFNDRSPINRRLFFYSRYHIDSLNSETYAPFTSSMVVPTDGIQRTGYAISSLNDEEIFMAYYDVDNASVLARISTNGGQSWRTDTLTEVLTNAPIEISNDGDSIYVLVYDGGEDALTLFSRAIDQEVWFKRAASIQETRGRAFSSKVIRVAEDRDDLFIAFNESGADQLYYGERIDGNWTYEAVDISGQGITEVKLYIDEQERPCMAYVFRESGELRFASKKNGVWQTQIVEAGIEPGDISLTVNNEGIHIGYYEISTGSGILKYATAPVGGNTWQLSIIDETSPIVGKNANLHSDNLGNLHIAYSDVISQRLKYAFKPVGGAWAVEFLTESFATQPERMQMLTTSNNQPVIAFRDALTNRIVYATYIDTAWEFEEVRTGQINFLGNPLRLILDQKDRAWILYNFVGVFDELRLVRQDISGSWENVSVINNQGMIANSFDFHLTEEDFYILGKKNGREDKGIGMLFAKAGVTTNILDQKKKEDLSWIVYPNPANEQFKTSFNLEKAETISLELFDLQGKKLFQILAPRMYPTGNYELKTDLDLASGMYLLKIKIGERSSVKKLMIER